MRLALFLALALPPAPSAALVRIGFLDLDTAYGVQVIGSLAYVGTASGLSIVDVSDGTSPSLVGQLDLPATVRDLEVVGGRAYLATVGGGFRVVDVADPSAPAEIGSFDPGVALFSLEVAGTLAYATGGDGSLRILDVSLGSEEVDAAQIDSATLRLGPAAAPAGPGLSLRDLDRDGRRDLVARFRVADAGLAPGDASACLRARLLSGDRIEGCVLLPAR